ncbi:MAG: hypothetical protein P8009_03550 [Gammaproteobacteria bacterium]
MCRAQSLLIVDSSEGFDKLNRIVRIGLRSCPGTRSTRTPATCSAAARATFGYEVEIRK